MKHWEILTKTERETLTWVSKRRVVLNSFPLSVFTTISIPGLMALGSVGISIVYFSKPVSPNVSASSPCLKHSGMRPIPTRLLRWMRSKLLEITALTPCFIKIKWRWGFSSTTEGPHPRAIDSVGSFSTWYRSRAYSRLVMLVSELLIKLQYYLQDGATS